jgi:hypothetical protein
LAKANSNPQINTPTEIRSVALYARVFTVREITRSELFSRNPVTMLGL